MFCKNGWTFWTRTNELENDKPTLHTKTTMFWISMKLCSLVALAASPSWGIWYRGSFSNPGWPKNGFCHFKCSNVIHKISKFTDRGLWCTAVQMRRGAVGWRRGLWSHCFFFFNRTENIKIYKDGWRQSNPSECFCACHVHERERRRLSDISAEGHTRQQGTNVYLSMCVCVHEWGSLIVQCA